MIGSDVSHDASLSIYEIYSTARRRGAPEAAPPAIANAMDQSAGGAIPLHVYPRPPQPAL